MNLEAEMLPEYVDLGTYNKTSLNPDSYYEQFGPYTNWTNPVVGPDNKIKWTPEQWQAIKEFVELQSYQEQSQRYKERVDRIKMYNDRKL